MIHLTLAVSALILSSPAFAEEACERRQVTVQLILPADEPEAAWRKALRGCSFVLSDRQTAPWVTFASSPAGGIELRWTVLEADGSVRIESMAAPTPKTDDDRRELLLFLDDQFPRATPRRAGPWARAELGSFVGPTTADLRGATTTASIAVAGGWRVDPEPRVPGQPLKPGLGFGGSLRVRPVSSLDNIFDGLSVSGVDLLVVADLLPLPQLVVGFEGGLSWQIYPKVPGEVEQAPTSPCNPDAGLDCPSDEGASPPRYLQEGAAHRVVPQLGLSIGPHVRLAPNAWLDLRLRFSADLAAPELWVPERLTAGWWRGGLSLSVAWAPVRAVHNPRSEE